MELNYDPASSAVFRAARVELRRKRAAADRRQAGIALDMQMEARHPHLGLWCGPGDALGFATERDVEITMLQELVTRLLTQLAAGPHLPVAATGMSPGGDGSHQPNRLRAPETPVWNPAPSDSPRPTPPIEKPKRRVLPE